MKKYIYLREELGSGNLPIWKDFTYYKFEKYTNSLIIETENDDLYINIFIDIDNITDKIYFIQFSSSLKGEVDTNFNLQYRIMAQIVNIILSFKNFIGDDVVFGYNALRLKNDMDFRRHNFYKKYLKSNNIKFIEDGSIVSFYFNDAVISNVYKCIYQIKKLMNY